MVGSGTPTLRRCHCLCRMLLWRSRRDGRSRGGSLPHAATMWVTAWAEAHPPEPRCAPCLLCTHSQSSSWRSPSCFINK